MARISRPVRDEVWFYPDGETENDDNPFRVLLTPMTGAEIRKLERDGFGKVTKRKSNVAELLQQRINQIIGQRVSKVEGYAVQPEDGSGLSLDSEGLFWPKNGEELIKAVEMGAGADLEVIDTIFEALRDHSVLGDSAEKKSE